jgi:hypothetical protein
MKIKYWKTEQHFLGQKVTESLIEGQMVYNHGEKVKLYTVD